MKLSAIIGAVVLFLALESSYGQDQAETKPHIAPSELTILKHNLGSERRFVTESIPESQRGGEPATRVASQVVMTMSVKAKSNTPKTIVGLSWYFILTKPTGEQLFSIPFVTPINIASQQTKTFKGEIDRLPRPQQGGIVTVDELQNPDKRPAQERIVVTCLMFSDGSFSPLNEASKNDCGRLQPSLEIQRKIEKL